MVAMESDQGLPCGLLATTGRAGQAVGLTLGDERLGEPN